MHTGNKQDQDQDSTEAPFLRLAEERQNRILNANYEAIDLDAKINAIESLSEYQQKEHLIKTLKKFPTLCSGGLGTTDVEPIHIGDQGRSDS